MGKRYSEITIGNKREIVLLKGFPCRYGRCKFCNYIEDNTTDENVIEEINQNVLNQITGKYKILEVINSGSVFELPKKSLKKIKEVVKSKNIKILYFEIYYGYINRIKEIEDFFYGVEIRFKMGLETFDNEFRIDNLGKNFIINKNEIEMLSKKLYSICLLVCIEGQTKEMIDKDINLGLKYFKNITINIFIDNGILVKRDNSLVEWFLKKYIYLKDDKRVELLIDNKDLGVFEQ